MSDSKDAMVGLAEEILEALDHFNNDHIGPVRAQLAVAQSEEERVGLSAMLVLQFALGLKEIQARVLAATQQAHASLGSENRTTESERPRRKLETSLPGGLIPLSGKKGYMN